MFGRKYAKPIKMFVFGDSLTDIGNHFAMFGSPPPPFFEGRYSNGPVWAEYLGDILGFPRDQVVNYAVGGATSGRENAGNYPEAPGMLDELDRYLAEVPGSRGVAEDTLFVIWIGANDFEAGRRHIEAGTMLPQDIVASAMANIRSTMETLAATGAKRFLVGNLPDLGLIPLARERYPHMVEIASLGSAGFNDNLMWLMAELESQLSVDVTVFDVYRLFAEARACPGCFGMDNVSAQCMDWDAGTICPNPDTYLFWDLLHPTTAAHRIIAARAAQALATGGLPLPEPSCPSEHPTVVLTSPRELFTTEATTHLEGQVHGVTPPGSELLINGVSTGWSADGTFAVDIPLVNERVEFPITVELRDGLRVLDRDRAIVFRGDSLSEGATASKSVLALVNGSAVPAIRDEVIHQLLDRNIIDFWPLIPDAPIGRISIPNFCDLGYDLWKTYLNYSCPTVDAEFHQGFIRLRMDLHDINLGVGFHGWLYGCPDPGLDCSGNLYVPHLGAQIDVAIRPRPDGAAGEVIVIPTSPLAVDPVYAFASVDGCDPDFLDLIEGLMENFAQDLVGPAIQEALNALLESNEDESLLAQELEKVIAAIKFSGQLGDSLGVSVKGDIQTIEQRSDRLAVWFKTAFESPAQNGGRTLSVPKQPLEYQALDPVGGEPYGMATSISLEALNQLLLVNPILEPMDINELDLGTGPIPITAGLLRLLIPSLGAESPETPYVLRVSPSAPPIFTGEKMEGCDGAKLFVGQMMVEFIRVSASNPEPILAVAVDLTSCATFGFNSANSSLEVELAVGSTIQSIVTENAVCANEATITGITTLLLKGMLGNSVKEFPLSNLYGMDFELLQTVVRGGYVSLYFQVSTPHGRPDLIVEEISIPDAIDRLFPFSVSAKVKNIGSKRADLGAFIGASLSIDPAFMNGNDIGLSQGLFDLHANPLQPGQSRWYTLNCPAVPWASEEDQTLFVMADVPPSIGGSGMLCESDNGNNHAGVTVLTTTADAYVASIEAPPGLVGGQGPGLYKVRVGRSNVGVDMMQVPVRVVIGNPPLAWAEAWATVPRGREVAVSVAVPTPSSLGSICGDSVNQFPVSTCANLQVDANRTNDCKSSSVSVAVPYFDLRYEVDGPSSARVNESAEWFVTVCNDGNATSPFPFVCSHTCIGLDRGENYSTCINGSFRSFNVLPLAAGACATFPFSTVISPGAQNDQFVKAGIDTSNNCSDACLAGNQDDEPIAICGAELGIADIEIPANLVGGVGPRTYYVTIRNDGCDVAENVWVRTCLGADCQVVGPVDVGIGLEHRMAVNLLTPPSLGTGGQVNYSPVTACLNNWADAEPGNNCRTEQAGIAVPFWDLWFEIVNDPNDPNDFPTSATRCSRVDWKVRVTNKGNVQTPNVCAITGIARYPKDSYSSNWNPNLGLNGFTTPRINAGSSWTYSVNDYLIGCQAYTGTQYVKVEVNYSAGCYDNYTAGNYHQRSITIH